MARVIIYKFPALTPDAITDLLALLTAAGIECDPELRLDDLEAQLTAPAAEEGAESEDPTDWVLIVMLSPECDADGGLSRAAGKVARAGGRAIGIWPRVGAEGCVPAAIERHGSDTVPWDAERLRMAISDETMSWATPTSTPRPAPITCRNKC